MKEFEKEYRQMIQEEMPDLWGRIEAGLKDRETGGQGKTAEKAERDTERKVSGRKGRKIAVKQQYYIGIAAACLCGAVMIPAAVSLLRAGAFGMGGFSKSTDSAAPAAIEAEEADRMPEEWQAEASVEETAEDAAGDVNTAPLEGIESEVSWETDGNGTLTENTADAENGAAENTDIPDQTIMDHVRVKILEVTDMQYHKLCLAAAVQDDSGWLAEGEELYFLSGPEVEMAEGAEYQVTLIYYEGAEVPFRLVEYGECDSF